MPFKWPVVCLVCGCVCVYTQGISTNKLGLTAVLVEGSAEVDGWEGPPWTRVYIRPSPSAPLTLFLITCFTAAPLLVFPRARQHPPTQLRAATMSGRVLLRSVVILWLVHVAHAGGEWKAALDPRPPRPMENTVINAVVWIVWRAWRRPVLFKIQDVTRLRKRRMRPF